MDDLNSIDLKIKYLEDKKKALEIQLNQTDRKARTKRLIQTGALCEKYFDIAHLPIEERELILAMFSAYIKGHIPEKYKKKISL